MAEGWILKEGPCAIAIVQSVIVFSLIQYMNKLYVCILYYIYIYILYYYIISYYIHYVTLYIYIYIHMNIYTYIHMYTYIRIYTYTYTLVIFSVEIVIFFNRNFTRYYCLQLFHYFTTIRKQSFHIKLTWNCFKNSIMVSLKRFFNICNI